MEQPKFPAKLPSDRQLCQLSRLYNAVNRDDSNDYWVINDFLKALIKYRRNMDNSTPTPEQPNIEERLNVLQVQICELSDRVHELEQANSNREAYKPEMKERQDAR